MHTHVNTCKHMHPCTVHSHTVWPTRDCIKPPAMQGRRLTGPQRRAGEKGSGTAVLYFWGSQLRLGGSGGTRSMPPHPD